MEGNNIEKMENSTFISINTITQLNKIHLGCLSWLQLSNIVEKKSSRE